MMIRSTRAAGLILLILLFLPRPVHGADHARIVVKKGHNYDSEYEICGQFDAQDFSSGRIPTESDRCVIFLGNRYQLVFVHGVTVANLMEVCGIDPEDVQALHFGGSNFFSADDILHGMNRTYVPDAPAYTYVGEGGTVMIDSSNIHYWAGGYGRLALFSYSEDVAFGQTMDHYYDGNVIRSKYEQFRQDLSKEALVEHALEEGLTLYYGQYQDLLNYPNRPVNAIRTINVILKDEDDGSRAGDGSGDGDGSGTGDSSGSGGENNNTGKNSAGSGKSGSGSGKRKSSSSAKAGGTKKTAGTKNSDKTTNSGGKGNSGGTKGSGSYVSKGRQTPMAAGGSDNDTSARQAQQSGSAKDSDQTGPEGKKEESEKEVTGSQDEADDTAPTQENTEPVSKASAGQMVKLKDSPEEASLTNAGSEAEPNIAVIFIMAGLVCCGILAGLVKFRMQLKDALASEP